MQRDGRSSAAASIPPSASLPAFQGCQSTLESGWHPTWLASRWAAPLTRHPSQAWCPALPPPLVRCLPPPWPAWLPMLCWLLLLLRRRAGAAWLASRAAASRPPRAAGRGGMRGMGGVKNHTCAGASAPDHNAYVQQHCCTMLRASFPVQRSTGCQLCSAALVLTAKFALSSAAPVRSCCRRHSSASRSCTGRNERAAVSVECWALCTNKACRGPGMPCQPTCPHLSKRAPLHFTVSCAFPTAQDAHSPQAVMCTHVRSCATSPSAPAALPGRLHVLRGPPSLQLPPLPPPPLGLPMAEVGRLAGQQAGGD